MHQPNTRVFVLASALTHLHPGAGRSPGVVDLPVVRDPLGYPYIPGSEVKGALKSMLARKHSCITNKSGKAGDSNKNTGTIDCGRSNECKRICCAFGGEPGEERAPSRLAVTDLYPLLLPLPSLDKGVVFATSPLLISRALALASESATIYDELEGILDNCGINKKPFLLTTSQEGAENVVYLLTSKMSVGRCEEVRINELQEALNKLNPAYGALGLNERVLVIPDSMLAVLVEKSLVRVTRVRLRRDTKTVETGGLWTEEYIPHTTLFSGAIIDTGFQSDYCSNAGGDPFSIVFDSGDILDIVIGGKESVGKGLLRIAKTPTKASRGDQNGQQERK